MKVFGFIFALILVDLAAFAVATANPVDDGGEMDLRVHYPRLAPSPPIATNPSASSITLASTATVTVNPASGGEVPSSTISSSTSKGSSDSSTSASPKPLFSTTTSTATTPTTTSFISVSSTSRTSSITDGGSTAAAGAPTPPAIAEGLGALAAFMVVAVL